MNDYSKSAIFNDKVKFLKSFSDFIGRKWLYVPESTEKEFDEFLNKYDVVICKPIDASCGKGVEKISADTLKTRYDEFKRNKVLIEEMVIQHPDMNNLYSGAVNTIRVATVKTNGKIEVLAATMRCGSGGGCIDNYSSGGIATRIDIEKGIGVSDGINTRHERFAKHPDSGVFLHGFQVPHWEKVIELVKRAALVVPGVNYIGWDVAVRSDDVVLIEGNFEGMFSLLQQPGEKGLKKQILELMK